MEFMIYLKLLSVLYLGGVFFVAYLGLEGSVMLMGFGCMKACEMFAC